MEPNWSLKCPGCETLPLHSKDRLSTQGKVRNPKCFGYFQCPFTMQLERETIIYSCQSYSASVQILKYDCSRPTDGKSNSFFNEFLLNSKNPITDHYTKITVQKYNKLGIGTGREQIKGGREKSNCILSVFHMYLDTWYFTKFY